MKRLVALGALVAIGVGITACGDSYGKRVNNACKWEGGLAHISPYTIPTSQAYFREITCRDGVIRVVLE